MSLTHEEYIVDVLTLLALNATASATATVSSYYDSDSDIGIVHTLTDAVGDSGDVDVAADAGVVALSGGGGGGGGGGNRGGPFVVVALNNQSIIADVTTTTATTTALTTTTSATATVSSTTMAMASAINPFASSISAFITSPTIAAAANITTAATTATGKIRFNADIWLIPCYSIILLFAVVGNVLVITTLVQNRRMRTITNVFLLNLAISDILLGVLCMPVTLVGTLLRHFIFGEVLCKLFQFSQAASVAVSSWTLVAISCERYYAICHPLRSRTWQTLSHAYKIIAFIWLGSVVCMTPIALFSQLMPTSRQGMRKCREQWPRDALAYERSYNIFLDLVLLILPLMVLCAAYILITRTLYVSMQNERAINFGNSGSSPAITAPTMYNQHSSKYIHAAMLQPSFTTTAAAATTTTTSGSTMAAATPSSSSSTSNGLSHATSNFSLTFRWNYRGSGGGSGTANTTNGNGSGGTNGTNKTSGGILVNGGGCMGRCRGDCCRISDELQSHANCTKQQQQQHPQQQFYYYDDLSSRSVGFGGIAHKRKQLTTPHNQHQNQNLNSNHQRQRHLYGSRSASIKSLNRCSNDNCYYRGPANDEHYVGNGGTATCHCAATATSLVGNPTNVYHMTTTTTAAAATTAIGAGATTTSLAAASASALGALSTSTGVTTQALTCAAVAATTTNAYSHAHAHNNQTMIVTNLTAQQPQRYKLYTTQRLAAQQATLLDGERYKMVTSTPSGMRMMDTTLRRTNTTKNLESKRRVVKMMFVLVLEFFICWTPLYVINTVAMFIGPAIYEYVDYTSISFFQLLAYSSSCCNPITYCFMNASFRRAFLDTFRGGLQWRRGRFKRHRRSKTETSLSAAGNSITLANSGATLMTTNTLLDSPRL